MRKLNIFMFLFACIIESFNSQNLSCGRGTHLSQFAGIVGGKQAEKGNWGWQVIIKKNGKFICGGSLINSQWVITAAHCIFDKQNARVPKNSFTVDVGVYDRKNPDIWSRINLTVSNVFVHPEFENFHNNDIALLRLKNQLNIDKVKFTIVPICLPRNVSSFQEKFGYATGFGVTEYQGKPSQILREVKLPILSDSYCMKNFDNISSNTHICAGQNGANKDTCQGDSGGPLVAQNENGRWYLVGISSYGKGCGDIGIYTKPSAFIDWIQTTISSKKN